MKVLTDITPLRENPAFRRFWIASTLSAVGSALTSFAVILQVYDITRSTAAVGVTGVAVLVPMLAVGLFGGMLADTLDRRKLVLACTVGQAAVSALLAAQAFAGIRSVWILYVLLAAGSAIGSAGAPARRTFIPALLPAGQLATGLALNRITFQVMLAAGPALAGLIAGTPHLGLRGCYLIDALSFAASLYGVGRLPAMRPPARPSEPGRSQLALTGAGLRFIWRNKVLAGAFLADVNATFFGLPTSLFPAINAERLGGDPRILGLFTAAIGAGGMVTAVLAGPVQHMPRQGLAMLVSVSMWGAAFAVFAVGRTLWLTLLALAVAGAADTVTVVFRGIIVQTVTPDEFRGRVNAADYVVGAGGGQLGSLEAGIVGSLTTPTASALIGGLLTIAGAVVIGAALPGFRRYRDRPEEARKPAEPAGTLH